MNTKAAISAYNTVGIDGKVFAADPHELISMLYEGALLEIAKAKNGILCKETASKGKSISRAISIIGEGLNASLDVNVGGELAQSLSSLYDYMARRLVAANLENDVSILDEVARLLTELKVAWDSINPKLMRATPQLNASANAQRAYAKA